MLLQFTPAGRCLAICLGIMVVSVAGCLPMKQARVGAVALTVQDVGRAAARQTSPTIVQQGMPAYLMLLDGLIEAAPDNKELLIAGCQGYATYASSFLTDEQSKEAEILYKKAKDYGFRALSSRGDFGRSVAGNVQEFDQFLEQYTRKDMPALFWTANAWAGWISTNISSVEAVADLPALEVLMKRLLELDDTYHFGGPHLLMGVYLAAKPPSLGGDLARSNEHFQKAFALGSDKTLAAKVLYAQYYARGAGNRDLFVKTLKEVQAASPDEVPDLTLSNVMAQEKAGRLLSKTEEYFEKTP